MNARFSEATTSVAFLLQLSRRQSNALLRLFAMADDDNSYNHDRLWTVGPDGCSSLERKGLVFWHQDGAGRRVKFGGLTKAGTLTALLLREAGLTIENTNTNLILRRLERHGATND